MRRAALAIVSTVVALVALLSFKTHGTASVGTPPAAISGTGSGSSGSAGSTGTAGTTSTTGTRTVTGTAVATRYGDLQVRVTLSGGMLTAVDVLQAPTGNPRDVQIDQYALPTLTQEALKAQSAHIDAVSGATYTSYGYVQSLQSALDKAHV